MYHDCRRYIRRTWRGEQRVGRRQYRRPDFYGDDRDRAALRGWIVSRSLRPPVTKEGEGGQHQCHTGVASVPLIDGHGNILGDAVQQTDSLYAGKFRSVVAACTGVYELDRAILHLQHAGQHRNVHDPTGRLTEIRDAVQRNSSFDKCRTRLCFRFPDTDGTDRSRAGNRTSTSGRRIDGVGLPVRLFQDIAFI